MANTAEDNERLEFPDGKPQPRQTPLSTPYSNEGGPGFIGHQIGRQESYLTIPTPPRTGSEPEYGPDVAPVMQSQQPEPTQEQPAVDDSDNYGQQPALARSSVPQRGDAPKLTNVGMEGKAVPYP